MKIEIQAPWQISRHFKNLVENRVEKFRTFYDKIIHVEVFLKRKEHSRPDDKVVEVMLKVSGANLFAEAHADNHEKAMVKALEKIKTQLIKRKERLQQDR